MELPVIQFIGNRKALKEEVEGQVGCPLAFPKLLFSCLHGNVHSLTCAYWAHGPGTSFLICDTSRSIISEEEQRLWGTRTERWPYQMFRPGCFHEASRSMVKAASCSSPGHFLAYWGGRPPLFSVTQCTYNHLSLGTLLTPKPGMPILWDKCPFIYDLTGDQDTLLCFHVKRAPRVPARSTHVKPGSPRSYRGSGGGSIFEYRGWSPQACSQSPSLGGGACNLALSSGSSPYPQSEALFLSHSWWY